MISNDPLYDEPGSPTVTEYTPAVLTLPGYTSDLRPDQLPHPHLIGVAGPSCAGKSEIAQRLAAILNAPVLLLDSYYHDLAHLTPKERPLANFDVPEALDVELLTGHLRRLSQGREIEAPVYDFTRHVRTKKIRRVPVAAFVIVEGLFALYWEAIRDLLDLKIFVDAPDEVCLQRRIERDVRERGRSPESVVEQFRTTVRPMADRYLLPTKRFADLVLDGTLPLEQSVAAVLSHLRMPLSR